MDKILQLKEDLKRAMDKISNAGEFDTESSKSIYADVMDRFFALEESDFEKTGKYDKYLIKTSDRNKFLHRLNMESFRDETQYAVSHGYIHPQSRMHDAFEFLSELRNHEGI